MRHVLAPAFLFALRLLLPLATCGWEPVAADKVWSNPDELVHLFTSDPKIGYYLQIRADGQVERTKYQNANTAVVIKNITMGVVKIIAAKTGLNLCMHSNGEPYATATFSEDDCVFNLQMLEVLLHVFESVKHKLLLSLGTPKGPLASAWDKMPPFSQFLIRKNEVPLKKF